ncbi:MAG: futalosine hydrolase [Saprospirales bacterium]|nr:futalosine hydrolase [Saprospirales bacterium]
MHILVVAATPFEIAPTLIFLEQNFQQTGEFYFEKGRLRIQLLITGVGAARCCWFMGQLLAVARPDWAVNAGVAGALDRSLSLGTVVQIKSDFFGDLGVEEADGRFTSVFELGLCAPEEPPFINGLLYNPAAAEADFLPAARALTVNRVHGHAASIELIREKYPGAQVETMEGAAFFYACLLANIPFVAIRSISNYVEPRNREAWELGRAIEQLNLVLIQMLESIIPPVP